ncbi:MAG: hypothetical protein J6D03_03275 [Clostridia bacterium]|nr:hypothetical protein [Clostridia bacterium]
MIIDFIRIFKKAYNEFYKDKHEAKKKIKKVYDDYIYYCTVTKMYDETIYNLYHLLYVMPNNEANHILDLINFMENGSYMEDAYITWKKKLFSIPESNCKYYYDDMKLAYVAKNYNIVNDLYEEYEKTMKRFIEKCHTDDWTEKYKNIKYKK